MSAAADHTADSASSSSPSSTTDDAGGQLFREHVLAGPGFWIAAVAVGAALGLVVVPLNLIAGIVVSVISIIILVVIVLQYSPVLEVSEGRFLLGRAQIDVDQLGEPQVLKGEEWALTIGQDFEPLAHHCVRGWTRSGLRVEVLDPEDPTTAWVASTRRPDDLALALRTAQQLASRRPR